MNSLVKDKYLIWTAIGVVVCVVSLGIAIGIGNDFNDDNFVRLIVFLCCNVFGWLIYLFFQSFIFDAYQIYRMKFGKKESACEIATATEQTECIAASEQISQEPAPQEPIAASEPIEIHIDAQRHADSRANYANREKQEEEKRIRAVMEYIHYYMPRIADEQTVNHICTEVHQWMIHHEYKPNPILRKLPKLVNSVALRHFVWNIAERFMYKRYYSGDVKANFIRALFPEEFIDTDCDTTKNFKVNPRLTEIPIDDPEGNNLNFHYPEDYQPKHTI